MMVVDFKPHHLAEIELHREIDRLMMAPVLANPDYGKAMAAAGPCHTILVEGHPVACLGLMTQWEGRAVTWALMTSASRYYMTGITRVVTSFLRTTEIRRIEAAVDCQFDAAVRWAELLGFKREGVMRKYTPDGRDCFAYARVR